MKKTEETTRAPGWVLMSCSAGPDGVGGGMHRAGNQAVHLAHGEHHGAEHHVVLEGFAARRAR